MNNVQKNYKKQMKEIEADLRRKERHGQGVFTNNLYKDNFYGDTSKPIVKKKSFWTSIIVICVVLFLLNPTQQDFTNWAKIQMVKQTDTRIEDVLSNALADSLINMSFYRENYILFSIFIPAISGYKNEKVLGIAKVFIPLK
jgi:uncharacterized membrane protein YvbJ